MKVGGLDQRLALIGGSGALLNAAAWAVAFTFPRRESAAILHYTTSVGIDFVGEGRHIMVLPAVGLLILIVNLFVGRVIMNADERTAWVLWSAVPMVQVFLLLALFFLKNLNS